MPYSAAISFAMGPAMTMATVLLAVAMSMSAHQQGPCPAWPPRLPRNIRRIDGQQRVEAAVGPDQRAQGGHQQRYQDRLEHAGWRRCPCCPCRCRAVTWPVARVMAAPATMPTSSTTNTFMPRNAADEHQHVGDEQQQVVATGAAVLGHIHPQRDDNRITARVARAAGRAILKLALELVPHLGTPWVVAGGDGGIGDEGQVVPEHGCRPSPTPTHRGSAEAGSLGNRRGDGRRSG